MKANFEEAVDTPSRLADIEKQNISYVLIDIYISIASDELGNLLIDNFSKNQLINLIISDHPIY